MTTHSMEPSGAKLPLRNLPRPSEIDRMRRFAFVACLLLLASTCLATGASYSEVRTAHPSVDQAINQLPSTRVRTLLGQISNLLGDRRVASLEPGQYEKLPAGYERQMGMALDDLARELERGLPSLSLPDRLNLAQAVNVIAFERNLEIHAGLDPCDRPEACPDQPAVLTSLQHLSMVLAASIRTGIDDWERTSSQDLTATRSAAGETVNAVTFDPWLEGVCVATPIRGVESIDD